MYLIADFETRSEAEITECGLHNYATHPSTRALMLGWRPVKSLDDKKTPVEIWEPRLGPMPKQLSDAINDPLVDIISHNSAFERYIFDFVLHIKIPTHRFQDTQPSARYLSLPAKLAEVCEILGLPEELRKDKRGEALMKLFSFPQTRKKKDGGGIYFNEPEDFPKSGKSTRNTADRTVAPSKKLHGGRCCLGCSLCQNANERFGSSINL